MASHHFSTSGVPSLSTSSSIPSPPSLLHQWQQLASPSQSVISSPLSFSPFISPSLSLPPTSSPILTNLHQRKPSTPPSIIVSPFLLSILFILHSLYLYFSPAHSNIGNLTPLLTSFISHRPWDFLKQEKKIIIGQGLVQSHQLLAGECCSNPLSVSLVPLSRRDFASSTLNGA